jgi:XTP/dITP diphosphohydrolase
VTEPLLIATTNPGKMREIERALEGLPVRLLTLRDVPPVAEPEETGTTFAENALAKARYYRAHSGLVTAAEDSGLAIDALGGRPGVDSARYPGATYADKFRRLYQELAPHPRPWTARFVCSVAVVGPALASRPAGLGQTSAERPAPSAPLFTCEASIEGEIAGAPRGANGFGYDPIFLYPPYGRTLGEVSDAEKLAVSHRGQAFRKLREWAVGALIGDR